MSGNSSASDLPFTDTDGGDNVVATAVEGTVIGLAIVCVALRFYIRRFTKAGLSWDDWFVLAGLISTLIAVGLLIAGDAVDPRGAWVSDNVDGSYVTSSADQLYLKLLLLSSLAYFTIAGTTKLGILLLYQRLFSVRGGAFRYQIAILCVLVTCYWIGCSVAVLTNCVPLERSWINNVTDPKYCFNFNIFWMAAGAMEVILDVLILALPVQAVVPLKLSTRKKLTVIGIFLLGAFVVITGLLKTILGYRPGDRNPSYTRTSIWTSIHVGMAIICACLPMFGPLVYKIAKSRAAVRLTNSAVVTKLGNFLPKQRRPPILLYDTVKSVDNRQASVVTNETEKKTVLFASVPIPLEPEASISETFTPSMPLVEHTHEAR